MSKCTIAPLYQEDPYTPYSVGDIVTILDSNGEEMDDAEFGLWTFTINLIDSTYVSLIHTSVPTVSISLECAIVPILGIGPRTHIINHTGFTLFTHRGATLYKCRFDLRKTRVVDCGMENIDHYTHEHEYVNVGFNSVIMACRICGQDKPR